MRKFTAAIAALTLCLNTGTAFGHGASQIAVETDGSQLVTYQLNSGVLTPAPVRVFEMNAFVDLGVPGTPVFNTSIMGFDADPAGPLADLTLGFNVLGPLLKWDGSAFAADPTHFLDIYRGTPLAGDIDTGAGFVPGFDFFFVDSGAANPHQHLQYDLYNVADASTIPMDGLYALEMELTESTGAFTDSPSFFLLFNKGVDHHDPEVGEARAFLNAQFVTGVPTPSALAGGLVALGALSVRRRR